MYNTVKKCISGVIRLWRGGEGLVFEDLVIDGRGPIYLQLIGYVKRGVVAGTIADGDELPSRRALSALLGVNPNTVQKAYAMLEEDGLIRSRSGARSFAAVDADAPERIRAELLEQSVRAAASDMRQMGVSRDEALRLLEKYWE